MNSARIAVLGVTHHTAPIALREKLSCSLAQLPPSWPAEPGAYAPIREVIILSTCNRTELYAALANDAPDERPLLTNFLAETCGVETAVFADHLFFHTGLDAARHLCRVAAGLDSRILGEAQIQGQVTDAYMTAVEAKTIGPVLTELFRTAIRAGKRARTETGIGHNPVSTSSMAIAKAQEHLDNLEDRRFLVIGLGEMGQLALKGLANRGLPHIAVVNRTRARAEMLGEKYGARVYDWADLPAALAAADVVISATSAPYVVVSREMVDALMACRPRPLVFIDIALPRDVETAVHTIPGVALFDADELQSSLDEALAARQKEIPRVEQIIRAEIAVFEDQLQTIAVKPVIVNLRQKAEHIRRRELERTLRFLGDVDEQTLDQLHQFSRSLVNKLLHDPTVRLKARAGDEEAAVFAAALNELFALSETADS